MSQGLRGFWRCVVEYRREIVLGWDLWTALALAIALAYVVAPEQAGDLLTTLASVQLGVATALFGVVLAGLAVIVAFLDEEYIQVLASVGAGLEEDFFHFWFTAALAVSSIVLDLAVIIAGAGIVCLVPSKLAVFVLVFPFLWSLFAALSLVPFTAAHGINRARQIRQGNE